MFFLPGCRCCGVCGWPNGVFPDSVELVLEASPAQEYTFNSSQPVFMKVAAIAAGTYSLPFSTNGFFYSIEYEQPHVFLEPYFRISFEAGGNQDAFSESLRFDFVSTLGQEGSPVYSSFIGNSFYTMNDSCASGASTRSVVAETTAAFDANNCSLPATFVHRIWFVYNGHTGTHTFPYTRTVNGNSQYGFDATVRVTQARYRYGATTFPIFHDIGLTGCSS